jgi:probable HAF family extracellular repeat protein
MTDLGNPSGGTALYANGVNADGSVIVGQAVVVGTGWRGFRWTPAGMVLLEVLPGDVDAEALGVSADGRVVVGYSGILNADAWTAVWWDAAGAVRPLEMVPGAITSIAYGVSGDGSTIVGNYRVGDTFFAVRWTDSGVQTLGGLPGATESFAYAASADGSIITGFCRSPFLNAFRYENESMINLGHIPYYGADTVGRAVSGDGSVIVGSSASRAFLWTRTTGTVNLNDYLTVHGVSTPGFLLSNATGVSADGTVVAGWGLVLAGSQPTRGWVLSGLPTPCYADCNSDTRVDLSDFGCFQTRFALGQPYGDCNEDGVRDLADFGCFMTKFAAGCP